MRFLTEDRFFGVIISQKHLETMVEFAQSRKPKETGGYLVGFYDMNRQYAVITDVWEGDGERDYRSYVSHLTDKMKLDLNSLWTSSSGTLYYVGEWHTHPGGPSIPSTQDNLAMSEIAANKKAECPQPISIILGSSMTNPSEELGVYVYPGGEKKQMKLAEEPDAV